MKNTIVRLLAVFLCLTALTAAAPDTPERQEFETAVNVPLFARLDLPASDGVRCILTTVPAKGTLLLREDGFFVYTPKAGRRGRDYFGYRLENEALELSEEATALLRISRPSAKDAQPAPDRIPR